MIEDYAIYYFGGWILLLAALFVIYLFSSRQNVKARKELEDWLKSSARPASSTTPTPLRR